MSRVVLYLLFSLPNICLTDLALTMSYQNCSMTSKSFFQCLLSHVFLLVIGQLLMSCCILQNNFTYTTYSGDCSMLFFESESCLCSVTQKLAQYNNSIMTVFPSRAVCSDNISLPAAASHSPLGLPVSQI